MIPFSPTAVSNLLKGVFKFFCNDLGPGDIPVQPFLSVISLQGRRLGTQIRRAESVQSSALIPTSLKGTSHRGKGENPVRPTTLHIYPNFNIFSFPFLEHQGSIKTQMRFCLRSYSLSYSVKSMDTCCSMDMLHWKLV